jgi:myo-inositol-1(or 4)-monophosphatase
MIEELLGFARELGRDAGRLLQEQQGRAAVSLNWDGSLVNETDLAVDRLVQQRIQASYPGHGILSEESHTVYGGAADGERFTWVIDPLDGTTNYSLGLCYWGCSIAVVSDGMPVVGVLVMPMLGAEFWAIKGGGAFLNGERLGGGGGGVSKRSSFVAICSRSWRYLELPVRQKGRLLGSAAYDLAAVAQGIAVGCSQVLSHIWDLAASWLLIQEAGRSIGSLLPDAPDPFPMVPGSDYESRVFPLAAGSDEEFLRLIQSKVRIKPAAQGRFDALAEAGWDMRAARQAARQERRQG